MLDDIEFFESFGLITFDEYLIQKCRKKLTLCELIGSMLVEFVVQLFLTLLILKIVGYSYYENYYFELLYFLILSFNFSLSN